MGDRPLTSSTRRTKLTPPEIARRWGISADKVVAWIRAGELRAVNAAARIGRRPRYLVDVADLCAFEAARAVVPRDARPSRTRQRRKAEVIEFF